MNKNENLLLKYAGLGIQFLVALGLGVFAGMKIDQWLNFKTPLAGWLLPLVIIFAVIFRIIKDTSQKK